MKKSLILLLLLSLPLYVTPLSAQEAVIDQPKEPEKKEEVKEPVVKKDDKAAKKKDTSSFIMGEIVVKERAIVNIDDAATATTITDKEIKDRSDKTLGDSLSMVPGVKVYSTSKGFTGFDMRGFQSGKVAVMIDGLPFEDVYYGGAGGDISKIPVQNVSEIIVNRGVSSALYGGTIGAIGSINIITKKPEGLYAEVTREEGANYNTSLNVAHGNTFGKLYYWITASYLTSNGYTVSEKLDKAERTKWFNKLVQYNYYFPLITLTDVTLKSKNAYLNDAGTWEQNSYRKNQVTGKIGYNITDNIEAGVSADYYLGTQNSSVYLSNTTASFRLRNTDGTGSWTTFNAASYTTDSKSAMFANKVFVWPEDSRYYVAPYFKGDFGDLLVRANIFFMDQLNATESYLDQAHTIPQFPSGTYDNTGASYTINKLRSIWEDTSYGFNLMPSYKFASWNRLSGAVMFRVNNHEEREKALDAAELVGKTYWTHGTGEYVTKQMQAYYATLALEDQMKFKTLAGDIALSAGISWDAQDVKKFRAVSKVDDGTLNTLVDIDLPEASRKLWGTRDAFNPVLGVVYDPIKDLLKLRGALSMKTEFPGLNVYSSNQSSNVDYNVKPEKSYNANAGFEVLIPGTKISFRNDYFYTKFKDKIESIYDPSLPANKLYANISGVTVQGIESSIAGGFEKIVSFMDLNLMLSYVYLNTNNEDTSYVTKGKKLEKTPTHQLVGQVKLDFITRTGLLIWGNFTKDQIVYVMKEGTTLPAGNNNPYTRDFYTTAKLHNPLMVNMKVSQKVMENFELYVMCKNVFDDYNADPFSPGPGRMFYFGGNAKL